MINEKIVIKMLVGYDFQKIKNIKVLTLKLFKYKYLSLS